MPQLKIICLSHPAVWSGIPKKSDLLRKMLALNQKSNSWLKLDAEKGTRQGIYKVENIGIENHVLAYFVSECSVKEEYPSLEKLLSEDGCLPSDITVPLPVPRATKALLFFDLNEGICYMYSPGMAPPQDSIIQTLLQLQTDLGLRFKDIRVFEWQEKLVTKVTEFARREGFTPYKVRADLETVTVTAEGDLDTNEKWKKIEGAVELEKWKTIAYVKSTDTEMFIFGLTKTRSKMISMPYIEDISMENLLKRILQMRQIVEKSLGCDVREYCFPEKVLSTFM